MDGSKWQLQIEQILNICSSTLRHHTICVFSVMLNQMHEQNVLSINSVLCCPEACLLSSLSLSHSLFSLSPGLHALHAEDETPGEVKRGAGMEFCSIYPPEIFLLERHTLFSLSLLTPCSPSHFSSLCDMWSFHFIPGWLSSASKHWCCPHILSCSIASGVGLHRLIQICSRSWL